MNVEAFLICDAATDQNGKLNVLGAFDNLFARQVPIIHRSCAIATRVRFSQTESGEHTVRIFIIDADGNSIGPKLEGNVNVRMNENVPPIAVNLILHINNLEFKDYGAYQLDLAIDDNVLASLPLHVCQIPQPQ